MKLPGKITILINREFTTIQVYDPMSALHFLEITLTPGQTIDALSRLGHTDCIMDLFGLDRVGMKRDHKIVAFEIPDSWPTRDKSEEYRQIAQRILDAEGGGWIADGYFGSQNSFFSKDGKHYARCGASRWL